ncbi:Zinc finger, TTF-type [Sesbania bispinosa]|nr:Zinc finger, TTF-type [Sesbania bispinosa]
MTTQRTLSSFFKKKEINDFNSTHPTCMPSNVTSTSNVPPQPSKVDERTSKCRRIQPEEMDAINVERDPRLRPMIWEFPLNQRDEVRRAYLKVGPYQSRNITYPFSGEGNNHRRFQASWFDAHSYWFEYSPKNDAIYCLPCYLFGRKESGHANAFILNGFNKWKKVNDGVNCPLLGHIGKNPNSSHRMAVKSCEDLKNKSQHNQRLFGKQA